MIFNIALFLIKRNIKLKNYYHRKKIDIIYLIKYKYLLFLFLILYKIN